MRFFTPAGEDLEFVREQRGAANQLAVALQLGALRWLGFVPEDLAGAPPDAVTALAETFDVPARAIFDYAVRAQTRGEHRLLVRAYAGFRPFSDRELDALGGRFVDAALEHERPSLLLVRLCEILRAERVERPSVDRLVRLVGWARERAHERTFERLTPQLTDQVRAKLDRLLVTDGGRCGLAWLRARPTSVSARALRRELEKRAFLIAELGAGQFGDQGNVRTENRPKRGAGRRAAPTRLGAPVCRGARAGQTSPSRTRLVAAQRSEAATNGCWSRLTEEARFPRRLSHKPLRNPVH